MENDEKRPGKYRYLILLGSIVCILSLTLLPICAISALTQPDAGKKAPAGAVWKETSTEDLVEQLSQLYAELRKNTETIETLNEQLEQAKTDYAAALETKDILDQRVSATIEQINSLNQIIEGYDRIIAGMQSQIDEHIAAYSGKYGQFLERLRQSYEEGLPSVLEIFFYSDSFIDMLTSIERADDILESDQVRMEELELETEKLLQERNRLLDVQKEKQEAEAQLQTVKSDLDARILECGQYIQQLETENLPALEKYLNDAKVAEDEINQMIEDVSEQFNLATGGSLPAEFIESKQAKMEELSQSIQEKMENGELQRGSEYFEDGNEYIVPVSLTDLDKGYVSSLFGNRTYSSDGVTISGFHRGIDFAVPFDSPIYAARSGVVLSVDYVSSYGNLVVILHENGTQTRYAHCNSVSVRQGEYVLQGEEIARVGVTGNATGSCCHLEVRIRENEAWQAVDPFSGYVVKPE